MKRFLLPLFLLAVVTAFAQNEQPFTLAGTVKNIPDAEKVYLSYQKNNQRVTDSMVLNKEKYSFKGTIAEPVMASLRITYRLSSDGKPRDVSRLTNKQRMEDYKSIFISPAAHIQASSTGAFNNMTVSGSPANDEFSKLEVMIKSLNDKDADLADQYAKYREAKDEKSMKDIFKQHEAIDSEMKGVYKSYVETNPASAVAPYAVDQYAGYSIDVEKVQPLFDKLSPEAKKFSTAVDLAGRIDVARKTSVGSMAMDFTQNDTLGKPVSLSSFRGKVMLVDFWASWCGPCRAENPNVVKAFNKYKDKGFYILGVSLDRPEAKENWMKAIHDDNLSWAHVSDLKFWDNDVAKEYGVRAIPFNVLIDKEGKIIGKNLRGEELEKKLGEVL